MAYYFEDGTELNSADSYDKEEKKSGSSGLSASLGAVGGVFVGNLASDMINNASASEISQEEGINPESEENASEIQAEEVVVDVQTEEASQDQQVEEVQPEVNNETAMPEVEVIQTISFGSHHSDAETHAQPAWADEHIDVAHNVNDNMSFGEAFAAARAEVGPGGAFEWHGKVYGTYTADEWNGMSASEKSEYNSHFDWSKVGVDAVDDSDVQAISADNTPETDGVEVEVLGVVQDSDSGSNIAGVLIDGNEALLIDFDGDMQFDGLAADVNNNGQIDSNEIFDIQDQNLSVADAMASVDQSFDATYDDMGPDYAADPTYDV